MLRARPTRMGVLLCAIAVLSLADLALTLAYARSIGMRELNPLARWIMCYQSPAILAAWKGLCVVVTCALLWAARRHRSAELGAWLCTLILSWLCLRWGDFASSLHAQDALAIAEAHAHEADYAWVRLPDSR